MAGIDFRPRRTFSRRTVYQTPGATNFSFCPLTRVFVPLCVHALNFRLRDFFIFVQSAYPRPSASVHRPSCSLPFLWSPLLFPPPSSCVPEFTTAFQFLRTRAHFSRCCVFWYLRGELDDETGDGSSSVQARSLYEKEDERERRKKVRVSTVSDGYRWREGNFVDIRFEIRC